MGTEYCKAKKESRFAVISPMVPVMGALDWRAVLKWGPAEPMRTKRTMTWGMKAHLMGGMRSALIRGGERWFRYDRTFLPFVYVKDSHAEYGYYADDGGGDDDAHDDGHVPTVDGRKHLSGDDAGNDAVSDHEDDVENGNQFRWPISHYIPSHDLERALTKNHRLDW